MADLQTEVRDTGGMHFLSEAARRSLAARCLPYVGFDRYHIEETSHSKGRACDWAGGETSRFEFRSRLVNIVNAFDRLSKTSQNAVNLEVEMRRFSLLFFEGIETE